jgi:hypothetical protein
MKKLILSVLCVAAFAGCKKETTVETTTDAPMAANAPATDAPAAIADAKYSEIIRTTMKNLSENNMDAWRDAFADNAKYYWSAGDSLIGKPAIEKFWRERRGNVIETLEYKNQILLPIKVNKPQATESAGIWVLAWYEVTAKYKGGSTMKQWIHMDYHFDANDKIDEAFQYIDRVPIMAAMPKAK